MGFASGGALESCAKAIGEGMEELKHALGAGRGEAPKAPGKYAFDHKLYHHLAAAAGLGAIVTGLLMMVRIDTPLWAENPYLLSDGMWGLVYVIHGLSGVALIAPDRTVRWAHISGGVGDYPAIPEVLEIKRDRLILTGRKLEALYEQDRKLIELIMLNAGTIVPSAIANASVIIDGPTLDFWDTNLAEITTKLEAFHTTLTELTY